MLFAGRQIRVAPYEPGYRLSEDTPVSDEFREEFHKWADKFFSPKCLVPENKVLIKDNFCVMTSKTYAKFKAANNVERALMQMEARYGSGNLY